MGSFTIYSTDKPSPKILIPFLTLHGLLFLGVGYILFTSFQIFALIHTSIGITIYLIFWRASFPKLFKEVLIGAIISVFTGLIFGDWLLDKFFWIYQEPPQGLVPKLYSMVVIFYFYFYFALIKANKNIIKI